MSSNSDNTKPQTKIQELLPEVYRSDVNIATFNNAFNRFLSKDDTNHVSGFIGTPNPRAIVNRQIPEETPFRQAYQLQPTMYAQVGDQQYVQTFKSFMSQLELMGVDRSRIQKWGNALQFNWVPPINIDKMVNYSDYFWYTPDAPTAAPQYLTIENRCQLAQSKVATYNDLIDSVGSTFAIVEVDAIDNTMTIGGELANVFVPNFVFYTKGTSDPALTNKFWTVVETTSSQLDNTTTVRVVESMTATVPSGVISLTEIGEVYQQQVSCACGGQSGWDSGPWDDNQIGSVLWNEALLASITSSTAPLSPAALDLWYDTTVDALKQRNVSNTAWVSVVNNFGAVIVATIGVTGWDLSGACQPQAPTQWSSQNRWIHKTQLQSFTGARRAQLPILEYNSTIELNQWTQVSYAWKYRALSSSAFDVAPTPPSRLELEPVKGYLTVETPPSSGNWYMYLFDKTQTTVRDIDFSTVFEPGFTFKIRDDGVITQLYTVESVEHIETSSVDPVEVRDRYMVTKIKLAGTSFNAPLSGGGPTNVRIEPISTSRGDVWRGYHIHWMMDATEATVRPAQTQAWNPFLRDSLENNVPTSTASPQGFVRIGDCYQEIQFTVSGQTTITLDPSLIYNPTVSQAYALAGADQIRLYVNGIRQYGTFDEMYAVGTPNYTAVGTDTQTNITFNYVTGITSHVPFPQHSTVRIEVGSAAFSDMGMYNVPVRTIEDEAAFIAATFAGTQPTYLPLQRYARTEQNKTAVNQYPLFDIFDVCTGEVIDASPTFKYVEDPTRPINNLIQRRIVISSDGRDIEFEQTLVTEDNGEIYGYRNLALNSNRYWFNPTSRVVKFWDGKAWTTDILEGAPIVVKRPTVGATRPSTPQLNDYWMDTSSDTLYQYDGSQWTQVLDLVVSEADPTLQTVWKRGLNDEEYVPQYVDKDRNPVPIGSPDGDWELPNQWFYNPSHHNIRQISFAELVTHFRTIINAQPATPGFITGVAHTLTQDEFNYGLGGTIKEYNDSYDTLMSAVNVTNVTPVGVIEFAENQYAAALLRVKDMFKASVVTYFTNTTLPGLQNVGQVAADGIVVQYAQNDFLSLTYGDTTAYNAVTGVGMPNWPATVPMFGLGEKVRPVLNVDHKLDLVSVLHHDGHRSTVSFTPSEEDQFSRDIIATQDPRSINDTYGRRSVSPPPATVAQALTTFESIRPGIFWYQFGGGVRELYRLMVIAVTTVAPPFDNNGVELPDGTYYYNTTSSTLYRKVGLAWNVVTAVGDGIITAAWHPVSFAETLGGALTNIEQRLYDVTPDFINLAFDYTTLTSTSSEAAVYDEYMEQRFVSFLETRDIVAPYANVTYNPTDAFTWNYTNCVVTLPPTFSLPVSPVKIASWQELYTRWYGTPYPHLEPWRLQGYTNKPLWWDDEYADTTGTRRWQYNHATTTGMWQNIRNGIVPAGRTYPNGADSTGVPIVDGQSLPTYNYVSVNIGDSITTDGYAPDDLFPPYYMTLDTTVRSVFTNFSSEIIAPSGDYLYGTGGPYEWEWSVASESVYDQLVVAFLMQPVRFMHSSFGPNFAAVDKLQVETTFCRVYSHENTLFHGDIYGDNTVYLSHGLNQWYVNFNRYAGYDTSGEFRSLWVSWDPKLSHMLSGVVDADTLDVSNRFFDVISQDYTVALINSGVVDTKWVDAFNVSILSNPPSIIQYNNQSKWRLSLNTLSPVPRTLYYYDVKAYPFSVDIATNTATAFRFKIVNVDSTNKWFYVDGDSSSFTYVNTTLTVSGSVGNDGTYLIVDVVYDPAIDRTRIETDQSPINSIGGGVLDLNGIEFPWSTGDTVIISSTKNPPAYNPSQLTRETPLYVIRLAGNQFRLAESPDDAFVNNPMIFLTPGDGELTIGELASSFFVFGGASSSTELWYHYALDKTRIRSFTPPHTIRGIQSLINIIDGYVAMQEDSGIVYNSGLLAEFDPLLGRTVSWQLETERFIDWAFNLRRSKVNLGDRYNFAVSDLAQDHLTFTSSVPAWASGTAVVVTTTGTLPSPLLPNTPYYIVSTPTPGVFMLSTSSNPSMTDAIIDVTSAGSGTMSLSLYNQVGAFPTFELNPIRNNVWINTPQGVLSNIIQGPYTDIRVKQTIFDQYGRPLTADQLLVYRDDKQSRITVLANLANDVEPFTFGFEDPYQYLHMGGAHLFVEGYEHAIIFNDYTVGNSLVYNPFLGLSATRFNLDYYEAPNFALRPALGGFFLNEGEFIRNIEGQVVDMQNYYDANSLPQNTEVAKYARNLVGYGGNTPYMDLLNVNPKSQFAFYRGMIQHKGSVNSVNAFINSRRFIDAKLDEFWAWKIASFGDSRPKVYPEIKLLSGDSINDDIRLQFMTDAEDLTLPSIVDDIANEFEIVTMNTSDRWVDYPEQKQLLNGTPLFFDAEVSSLVTIYADAVPPTMGQESLVDYWFNTSNDQMSQWDGIAWTPVTGLVQMSGAKVYIKLDTLCDDVRIVQRSVSTPGDLTRYTTFVWSPGTGPTQYERVNSELIKLNTSDLSGVIMVFTINAANTKLNPAKLIDTRSNTMVSQVPVWHPARGQYYHTALYNVDLMLGADPATYTSTPNPTDVSDQAWNDAEVRTRWFDTSAAQFLPYYDDKIYPNVNDRLFNWGRLADWGNIRVFQWVRADVPPDQYDAAVVSQSADPTIPQNNKLTGTPRLTTFKRTRTPYSASIVNITGGYQEASPTTYAIGTSGSQQINYGGLATNATPTGFTGSAPFQTVVQVDGVSYFINITAAIASTFGSLIAQLNTDLQGSATATITGGNIVITSNTTGNTSTVSVFDINLFTILPNYTSTSVAVAGTSSTYTTEVTVDGAIPQQLSFRGDDIQTVSALVALLNSQLTGCVASINGGSIRITSDTIGESSTILIASGSLFPATFPPVAGFLGKVQVNTSVLNDGDTVLFTTTGTLPAPLETSTQYVLGNKAGTGPYTFDLFDSDDATPIQIIDSGTGALTVVPTFNPLDWERQELVRQRFFAPFVASSFPATLSSLSLNSTLQWEEQDTVSVYVNGRQVIPSASIGVGHVIDLSPAPLVVAEPDIIDVVRFVRPLTDDERNFDPALEDDGTTLTQYMEMTQFTTTTQNVDGTAVVSYFYWVENATARTLNDNNSLSILATQQQLVDIPTPYVALMKPLDNAALLNQYVQDATYGTSTVSSGPSGEYSSLPTFYRQAVLRGVAPIIREDDRFVIRFTRDLTLRDNINDAARKVNLKSRHDEWFLFRREQQANIPRELWNRMVESIIGYKLDDPSAPVPALERVLYDATYGTDTQYGLGNDQSFVNGAYALATVLNYLQDPNVDFYPVDINSFFATHSFDTPENAREALETIYNNFGTTHVNRIWFNVLNDAFVTKGKYKELMKTSWIALHGIRVLEVGGLFDD